MYTFVLEFNSEKRQYAFAGYGGDTGCTIIGMKRLGWVGTDDLGRGRPNILLALLHDIISI